LKLLKHTNMPKGEPGRATAFWHDVSVCISPTIAQHKPLVSLTAQLSNYKYVRCIEVVTTHKHAPRGSWGEPGGASAFRHVVSVCQSPPATNHKHTIFLTELLSNQKVVRCIEAVTTHKHTLGGARGS
jgi:hypothetical protein